VLDDETTNPANVRNCGATSLLYHSRNPKKALIPGKKGSGKEIRRDPYEAPGFTNRKKGNIWIRKFHFFPFYEGNTIDFRHRDFGKMWKIRISQSK